MKGPHHGADQPFDVAAEVWLPSGTMIEAAEPYKRRISMLTLATSHITANHALDPGYSEHFDEW